MDTILGYQGSGSELFSTAGCGDIQLVQIRRTIKVCGPSEFAQSESQHDFFCQLRSGGIINILEICNNDEFKLQI
jgi:hypothetical protein